MAKPKPKRKPRKKKPEMEFAVTPSGCRRIRKLAGLGMSLEEVGLAVGLHPATLRRLRKVHPALDESYRRGRAEGMARVTQKLRKKIDDGNVIAMLFYLKTQGRWSEINGAPAAQGEAVDANLSADEMRERVLVMAKDWPEDLFRVMFEVYQAKHRCRVLFEDDMPHALPAPALSVEPPEAAVSLSAS